MTLPGMQPHPLVGVPIIVPPPAAYVFNGVDELLQRTLTAAGSTTIFTYSVWTKIVSYAAGDAPVFQSIDPTDSIFMFCQVTNSGDRFGLAAGPLWEEVTTPMTPDIALNTWTHLVVRYDSTQATANRIRLYRNGTLMADDAADPPGASEAHIMFNNGYKHQIGAFLDIGFFHEGRMAFIDVLDGVSADPTAFAFDNAGTWTRKLYTGSYGARGIKLDGTNGFNDTSGNAQHFSGINMDASNISSADMPPYTN